MPLRRRRSFALRIAAIAAACAAATLAVPESAPISGETAAAMTAAASSFLGNLDDVQRARAQLPFDSENRLDWHYVPRARKGIALKELSADERRAALALLRTGLSGAGFAKLETIRGLEEVLFASEGWSMRDPGLYFFTIFGSPSANGAWSWRYEGHHASLHWTVVDGKLAGSAPQFLGANPAEVREGPRRGTRALATEEDLGRALVRSLDADRRRRAIVSDHAPSDIASGSSRDPGPRDARGIAYSELDSSQQGIFLALLQEYAAAQPAPVAEARLARARAELPDMRFSWMGGIEKGEGHYYRIDGADFLIEYDNTQNGANHIHCVWRDRSGEWGRDLLAEHYRDAPHHRQAAAGAAQRASR
jgi:hypothetical protein